ncbi:hypothetical protein EJ08DRAFT_634599 [Tothia fuscella]|uniref:STE24 endopeptidase n=1 Tax=Tothia fuscella TaxID=1048955 RepID=A0A9P4NQY4_9PEZI|nr:hypothetical protein EJ08DRAFT_634599 [Tothia fuscella]
MPTPIDRAFQSRGAFLGFAGIITAVAAWGIWGSDSMFPKEADPRGDPENWSQEELRRWLNNRSLLPSSTATRAELLHRVKDNLKRP